MRVKMLIGTVLLGALMASVACEGAPVSPAAPAKAYVQAHVYLFHWNVVSNRVRSIDETRATHSESVEITDPAVVRDFVNWLNLGGMRSESDVVQHQALFVVDLVAADGSKATYYSDGCRLYSEDSKSSRPIDQAFRKQFDFYGDNMIFSSGGKAYNQCTGEIK